MTHTKQLGFTWAGIAMVISGISNFANGFAIKGIDPLIHNVVKNGWVGLLMLLVLILTLKRSSIQSLKRHDWMRLGLVAMVGGSIPFYLFFTGVKMIGSVEGSMIHKTLIIWVGLMAMSVLKEKLSLKTIIGIGLLFASNFVVGFSGFKSLTVGHALVLSATMLWAIENVIVKRWLKDVDVNILVTARMAGGSLILIAMMFASGKAPLLLHLSGSQWLMLVGVGCLLFGYVMSWYRALKVLPAVQVAGILVGATVITTLLDSVLVKHLMPNTIFSQIGLNGLGILLLLKTKIQQTTIDAKTSI
jgi:drug/metabolite transporter (DMT)-like permease